MGIWINGSGETWTNSGHILEVAVADLLDGLDVEDSVGRSEGWGVSSMIPRIFS